MARLFVPLDVEFATNDRILAAGPLAAYLYVCSLAYCKRQGDRDGREGFVHASALKVLAVGFPGKAEKHASALVDAGLWQAVDGGWVIPAWLKHNKSTDQLAADKQAAKEKSILGNHRRHHEAKGEKSPDCPLCYPSPQGSPTAPTGEEKRSPTAPKEKGKAEGRQREGKAEGRQREGKAEGRQREGKAEAEGRENQSSSHGSSNAPEPPDDDDVISLAIDLHAEHAARRADNPKRYAATVKANDLKERSDDLRMYLAEHPDATAVELAEAVLGVPLPAGSGRAGQRYADPRCESCDGDGLSSHTSPDDRTYYSDCGCLRDEPYPVADVVSLDARRPA